MEEGLVKLFSIKGKARAAANSGKRNIEMANYFLRVRGKESSFKGRRTWKGFQRKGGGGGWTS